MEDYDLLEDPNDQGPKAAKRRNVITSVSGASQSSASISAIVTLHQTRGESVTGNRINQTSRNQLIGILTENNANRKIDSTATRGTRKKTICMEPKLQRSAVSNVVQVQLQQPQPRGASATSGGGSSVSTISGKSSATGGDPAPGKQKIPRPANAFMLFANEWRKKLAVENPRESNKDISVRLGVLWKNMAKDLKEKYFSLAREVDAEHKRKYPDYVYNPKEARLRKAMREQSRELSRQSILQTAIASAAGSSSGGGAGNAPPSATGSTNFLNHPLNCPTSAVSGASVAAAAVSSLPGSPSFNSGSRIINPWFPGGHPPNANHLKPILSPRVMTVAQHQQQQQQQQRTFDKTKEVLRKQAECAAGAGFSGPPVSGYPSEFSGHGPPPNVQGPGHSSSAHEANDYCVIAEFSDGQKWHPYQNGPAPYHSRGGGPLTKMGALHPVQSGNPHGHGGWNQFCAMPLSAPPVSRTPRHMVFLQQEQQHQQQSQHCGYPEEMQIPYMQAKHMEIGHRLHPSYSQQEHQAKLQSSSISPINMSQLQEPEKCIEDGPRWESGEGGGSGTSEGSMGAMVTGHSRRESDLQLHQKQQEQERDQSISRDSRQQQQQHRERDKQQHYPESVNSGETKHEKSSSSKQPLPGFHQAFGSTEIGRFSRSEFFANMVGESSNVSTNNSRNSCSSSSENGATDLVDSPTNVDSNVVRQVQNVATSRHHIRGDSNSSGNDCSSQESASNEDRTNGVGTNDPSFNNSLAIAAAYYNDVRSPGPSGTGAILGGTTMPRWHSPYVNAIGSEI